MMKTKKMIVSIFCVLFVMFWLTAGEAKASLSYDLKYVLNGNTSINPAGWLNVEFANAAEANTVMLTITSNLPDSKYFFSDIAFNVDPNKLTGLSWGTPTMTGANAPTITNGENTQDVVGSGNWGKGFDVLLSFDTKGGTSSGTSKRFDDSDTLTLTLTGTGIDENSFGYLNTPRPGTTPLSNVGAHVQGLAGSTSSFISNVPIPSAVWLLGTGLLGLVGIRRRFKK
jgi:hypothetical protein